MLTATEQGNDVTFPTVAVIDVVPSALQVTVTEDLPLESNVPVATTSATLESPLGHVTVWPVVNGTAETVRVKVPVPGSTTPAW